MSISKVEAHKLVQCDWNGRSDPEQSVWEELMIAVDRCAPIKASDISEWEK